MLNAWHNLHLILYYLISGNGKKKQKSKEILAKIVRLIDWYIIWEETIVMGKMFWGTGSAEGLPNPVCGCPVSYTHLDVYKRQVWWMDDLGSIVETSAPIFTIEIRAIVKIYDRICACIHI